MSNHPYLIEQLSKAFDAHDVDEFFSHYASDCTVWDPSEGETQGIESNKALVAGYMTAFPDARMEIRGVHSDGEYVIMRGTFHGTNTGPLQTPDGEVPPTGKEVSLPIAQALQVRDGKIVRDETYYDQMMLMVQLGLADGA